MGLLGVIFPPEYGGAGLGYVDYVLAIEELSAVDGIDRPHRRRAQLARHQSHLPRRQRSAKEEVHSASRHRRVACRLGPHRARLRLRRQQRPHHRREKRGDRYILNGNKTFITNGRYADVTGHHRRHRQEQGHARPLGLHRGKGNQGLPHRQKRKQARPSRQRHQRAHLRRLRDPCREPARR